jgi:hypothetical protein
MPYQDAKDGHRILITDILPHCRQVFDQGLQLEAILLAHEYLEQRLNNYYKGSIEQQWRDQQPSVHRKFKNIIDLLHFEGHISEEDYMVLNEFNHLRNINAHKILDTTLELCGAKKGDMARAIDLAQKCDELISSKLLIGGSQKKNKKKIKPNKK